MPTRLMRYTFSILFVLVLMTGCRTRENVNATLWLQQSAEAKAIAAQTYQSAVNGLRAAMEDESWTAIHEQSIGYELMPTAVILDVDETVLDNSAFTARLARSGKAFDEKPWIQWCEEAKADAIPGAIEFTRYCAAQGVAVVYVTNRDAAVEAATRKNLQALGFPLGSGEDAVLCRGEKPGWDSDKAGRRAYVGARYRVLFLVGDDLNDFFSIKDAKNPDARVGEAKNYAHNWGERWFILPNPTYGSWERPYGGARAKIGALETRP